VIAAERALTAAGRSPTVEELAAYLRCAPEEVLEGMQASLAYSAVSLDAPTSSGDGGGGADTTLGDTVGRADSLLELVDDRATLSAAVQHLPKLERRILYLRFSADLSQREIASRVGISQMHVSRLLRSSLTRLREQIGESPAAA
jgi:RNA polymerase sigma-B factor